MLTYDWTAPVTAAIFLLTVFALNYLVFKPLARVLEDRRSKTEGLQEKARSIVQQYEDAFANYQLRLKEEKTRGYKMAEATRQGALGERDERIGEARGQAESFKEKAKEELRSELDNSRNTLRAEAEKISLLIAARILHREA